MAWASERNLPLAVVGLGSNLLPADEGVDGLVLKLAGDLASAEVEGELLVAGGGAPLAVCLHRARAAGLGGIEFACAIPGTAGGGVWMNAGAYGGDIAGVLVRALVVSAEGAGWLTPSELGMRYRHSELRHGQVVARAEFRLTPRPGRGDQGDGGGHAGTPEGGAADQQAHLRQRVQEPRPRAERGADAGRVRAAWLRDRRGGRSHPVTRTSSRTQAERRRPTRSG